MQTIQLVGAKSVMQFDLEVAPISDFVQFQGEIFQRHAENHLVWELFEGDEPPTGSLIVLDGGEPRLPVVIGPHLETPLVETPDGAGQHAEPDHAQTV